MEESEEAVPVDPWASLDSVVFDEAFVRAGVHEPPARTRIAIAQQQRARQQQPQVEPDSQPATTAAEVPLTPARPWRRVVALTLIVGLLAATMAGRSLVTGETGDPTRMPAAGSVDRQQTNDPDVSVTGIAAGSAAGGCYRVTTSSTTQVVFGLLPCASTHSFEVVSQFPADSANGYPAADYWTSTAWQQCLAAALSYTGTDRSRWPVTRTVVFLRPSLTQWSAGDRTVFCSLRSVPPTTGSARG